jgi:hypothetical protein
MDFCHMSTAGTEARSLPASARLFMRQGRPRSCRWSTIPLRLLVAWTAVQAPERTFVTPAPRVPGSYDMAAAFMLFQVHGWDIHAV